jgi:tripartite-type tricarboxylate transporter receptor subunit TctC
MQTRRRAIVVLGAGSAVSLILPRALRAQGAAWPVRPITVIVAYPAGGANDIVARSVAEPMRIALSQPLVVENRGGAAGTVGAAVAARAAPDGYTLFMAAGAHTLAPSLFKSLSYDIAGDFRAISQVAASAYVLAVNPQLPVKNVGELIAYAKANPGKLNYCSSGAGAPPHLAAVLFQQMSDTRMEHVPYQGDTPALTDLVAGHVQLGFMSLSPVKPLVDSGKLRALAVTGLSRSSAFPDAPTIDEAGLKGYAVSTWWGLLAPKGTPEPVIARVHAAVVEALKQPDVVTRFRALGIEPTGTAPDAFQAFIRDEVAKFARLAKTAGVEAK